jgi:hypothetical protein
VSFIFQRVLGTFFADDRTYSPGFGHYKALLGGASFMAMMPSADLW